MIEGSARFDNYSLKQFTAQGKNQKPVSHCRMDYHAPKEGRIERLVMMCECEYAK